tara:strand:+ start:4078 stop:4527 length:450 start_codon:yes stop_codon:yes gene_type:complete
MPSKRPKAEAGAEAAPRLPRLPDELWEKIWRDVAYDGDADLAALRLVNKHCAKTYAHRQYGLVVRRMFSRKRQWREEDCLRKTQWVSGTLTPQEALKEKDRLQAVCDGEVWGDLRMERFIWELGANPLLTTEAIPFLTACIDTLRELSY